MKVPKYVQVSPDYYGDGWWDPKSQMWFKKELGVIELKEGIDTTNIVRYLNFNYIMDADKLVNPPPKQPQRITPIIDKTANQLLNEDIPAAKAAGTTGAVEATEAEVKESGKEACPYCGKEYSVKGITAHKKSCKKNPDNQ